jgi:hypothetical protein
MIQFKKQHKILTYKEYIKIILDNDKFNKKIKNILVYYSVYENFNHKLRIDIKLFAKFIVAEKRQAIYKNIIMNGPNFKKLPIEIIDNICQFTYDPYLLF